MNTETMSIIRDGNQEWVRIPLPGAELFIVFDGKDGRYLDNFMEDGSIVKLDMPLLKALEGVTQAEADQLDIMSLVKIIPAAA